MRMNELSINRYLRNVIPYILICILMISIARYKFVYGFFQGPQYHGRFIGSAAKDFHLSSTDRDNVNLSSFKGKYLLLTFGFTKCTSVCPLNLQRFKRLAKSKIIPDQLHFAFVSFDTIRDDRASVEEFINHFEMDNLTGLISGQDSSLNIANQYFESVRLMVDEIKKDDDFQIDHNGFIYLIDPDGNLAILYSQKEIEENSIISDIKTLMRNSGMINENE